MFEKFALAAERAAMRASRREFLGRLGKAAMGAAGAVGAVLLLAGDAQAHSGRCWLCSYRCPDGTLKEVELGTKCPRTNEGCTLTAETRFHCF
jgi:hypothetical protein